MNKKAATLVAIGVGIGGLAWYGVARTPSAVTPAARPRSRAMLPRATAAAPVQLPEPHEVAPAAAPKPTDQELARTLDETAEWQRGDIDAAWGTEIEARVGAYLDSPRGAGSSLTRAECRTTLCKLEVAHASLDAAEHFAADVSVFLPAESNPVIQPSRDGATRTVVWITRRGPATGP